MGKTDDGTSGSNGERGFLRGLQTYGDRDFSIYMRRAFAKSMGYSGDELARPVVGIAFTHSKFNPCHRHFPELLEAVKRGVAAAGGLALEFPTISLHESTLAPNSMKFRNLMAMDTEEMIRAQPMDAVVLMGGCDKTVPAQLMGAASAGKPAIQLIGGPQMTSRYKDDRVGACTDCRKFWTKFRAGEIGKAEIEAVEGRLVTTSGTCAVMGTASTMAAIAEALGMILPGTAAIPAVHADRLRAAEATGARAVALARSDLTPDKIITQGAVDNAVRVLLALGGSTNGVIHLAAIAGRLGLKLDLKRLERAVGYDAGAGGGEAGRQRVLHGGLLRRRRHRRGAARIEAAAQPRLHDRSPARRCVSGWRRRRAPTSTAASSSRRVHRWSRRAGWSRCSARWRRTAPSSSGRRRRRRCSRRRARAGVLLARRSRRAHRRSRSST